MSLIQFLVRIHANDFFLSLRPPPLVLYRGITTNESHKKYIFPSLGK